MFNLTPVVRAILITNVCLLVANSLLHGDINQLFGLYYFQTSAFKPVQLATYMFLHANFMHLFSNMFGFAMMAPALEMRWGSQKFTFYYLFTAIGAALLHWAMQYYSLSQLSPEYAQSATEMLNLQPMVGASGAIFGILLAFGMLYPNQEFVLFPIPIPIKAKYFVILYALFELRSGVHQVSTDNVAHFAHLGGMLFGFLLLKYWNFAKKQ